MVTLPRLNGEEPPSAAGSPPHKTVWSGILSATPVVLTVVATLLAGLSNSEMIQAQYHRALAAQNQSKAGDQWGLFQAKRIRGTSLETTRDLLGTLTETDAAEPISPQEAADRLLERLRRAEQEADRLRAVLKSPAGRQGPAAGALQQAAATLVQTTAGAVQQAKQARERIRQELAAADVRQALSYLRQDALPEVKTRAVSDPAIGAALRAIQERRPEAEVAPLVAGIPEDALQRAIALAQANAEVVEEADKPVSAALAQVERFVQAQLGLARGLQRAVRAVDRAAAELPAANARPSADLRPSRVALDHSSEAITADAERFRNAFKAAQYDYNARRYRREASWNEEAAKLYELQVRRSGVMSERHRSRSKHFFYGMLAAQAGVTIASFSLALKHKSILWALATLAGIGAVVFGLYVYLYQ